MQRRRPARPVKRKYVKRTKDAKQDREIHKLQKAIGKPELKYHDFSLGNDPLTNTPTVISLSGGINQGIQPFERIGNQVKSTYIRIKGYIVVEPNEQSDRIIRLQLFWDRNPPQGTGFPTIYGSTSSGVAALNDNTNLLAVVPDIFAPHSVEYKDRFKVIKEKYITLSFGSDNKALERKFDFSCKLNRVMRFDNVGPGATSVATNGLFLAYSVDNSTSIYMATSWTSRLFFLDA